MKTKANDLIYPLEENNPESVVSRGLTKREYFAAMAMQGLCANGHSWEEDCSNSRASRAVTQADALITELNKPQQTSKEMGE